MLFPINDQPTTPPDQLLDGAYRNARYGVNDFSLRIGEPHPDFDRWLTERDHTTYLLITAHNPKSRLLSPADNLLRTRALILRAEATGFAFTDAYGADPKGDWPREESLCLLDAPSPAAYALGREFGQNAVVEGARGGVPRLVWLR